MRVGKQYLGKLVHIVWRDPTFGRQSLDQAPRGTDGLSVWHEYGRVGDITDGVVRLHHSEAITAPIRPGAQIDEVQYTVIPEVLIEELEVLAPAPAPDAAPERTV